MNIGNTALRGAALAALATAAASTAAAQPPPAPPPSIDQSLLPYASLKDSARLPDGRTIHLTCMGQGAPVVILTAGSGNWGNVWNKVQPEVAKKTRVCAWDRAGFGLSSPSPQPQTADNRTSDLQAALKAARINGPYVVVGHSLGGYESLLLKDREPKQVVGMVLVDVSIPDQSAIFQRAMPATTAWSRAHPSPAVAFFTKCVADLRAGTIGYGKPDPAGCTRSPRSPTFPPELRAALDKSQIEAGPQSFALLLENQLYYQSERLSDLDSRIVIKPGRNYGAMPLIVLTAGDDALPPDLSPEARAEGPAFHAELVRGHDALAALSTRGVNRVIPDTTHYIQQLKPQVVIDAIDEVVDAARRDGR